MGATIIVDDPELASILSGAHLPTSGRMEGWASLAARGGDLIVWDPRGNRTRIARMVAQCFTHCTEVQQSRSIKNIWNSAIHWFLCNCGIIWTLRSMSDPWISDAQSRTIKKAKINFKSKEISGIIRDAVLLEKAALSEEMRFYYFFQ